MPQLQVPPHTADDLFVILEYYPEISIRPEWFLDLAFLVDIWDEDLVFAQDWGIPRPGEIQELVDDVGVESTIKLLSDPENFPLLEYHESAAPYGEESEPSLSLDDYRSIPPRYPDAYISDYESPYRYLPQNYYTKAEVEKDLKRITYAEFPSHLKEFIYSEFSDVFTRNPGLFDYVQSMWVDFEPQDKAPGQLAEYFKSDNHVEWYAGWEWSAQYIDKRDYTTPASVRKYFIDRYINYTISHEIAHSVQNYLHGKDMEVAPYPDEEHPEYREFGEKYEKDPGEQHARDVAERYKQYLFKNPKLIPPKLSWQSPAEVAVGDEVMIRVSQRDLVQRLQRSLAGMWNVIQGSADWEAVAEYILSKPHRVMEVSNSARDDEPTVVVELPDILKQALGLDVEEFSTIAMGFAPEQVELVG